MYKQELGKFESLVLPESSRVVVSLEDSCGHVQAKIMKFLLDITFVGLSGEN